MSTHAITGKQRRGIWRGLWTEGLERRMLLSAATPAPMAADLSGTYSGSLVATTGSVILGVPYRQQISLTFSPGGSGQLNGLIAVEAMGTASLNGAASGRQFTAVFGDNNSGAGAITGATERNGVITGSFREIMGGNTMTGVFRVSAGGSTVATTPLESTGSNPSTSTNESVLNGNVRLRGAGYQGFTRPATLDITGGTSGGVITGTFTLDTNTFTLNGISSRKSLTFVLSGPGSGFGSATLGASGVALSGNVVANLPNGAASGPFVVYQPATSGTAGANGTATNQYAVSTLFGSVGGFAAPAGGTTTLGGTGATGTGGSISTLPPSNPTGSLPTAGGTGGGLLGGTGGSGSVVDSFNPVPTAGG
jgi:collagen type VII alpha